MAARTTCPPAPAAQESDLSQRPAACIEELERATEYLTQALEGLRNLARQPGYESVDRLLTGYIWSIEQLQEVNARLKDQLQDLESKVNARDK